MSATTRQLVGADEGLLQPSRVEVKGKGLMDTYIYHPAVEAHTASDPVAQNTSDTDSDLDEDEASLCMRRPRSSPAGPWLPMGPEAGGGGRGGSGRDDGDAGSGDGRPTRNSGSQIVLAVAGCSRHLRVPHAPSSMNLQQILGQISSAASRTNRSSAAAARTSVPPARPWRMAAAGSAGGV